jgi:hypothetical protein
LHPGFGAAIRWLIAVLVTLSAMLVNLRGVRDVGRSSKFCTLFVLSAFALLITVWLIGGEWGCVISRAASNRSPHKLLWPHLIVRLDSPLGVSHQAKRLKFAALFCRETSRRCGSPMSEDFAG